ncbi:MAG: VCBS repeat-containing protein [Thermoanaerobaculia bacterium]
MLVRPKFTDVIGERLDRPAYGGAATGDYDGDGVNDLYLTNYGANRLLRGLGDCRLPTRPPGRASATNAGAPPQASSTSTATATSTCSSATT